MESRQGKKWNREETILAFELYCRLPFGKIDKKNPEVIELAKIIGRTPDSVSMKILNLAHFDPIQQARGVTGLSNGSALDSEIVSEFRKNLGELAYQAQIIKEKYTGSPDFIDLDMYKYIDIEKIPDGTYRNQLMKERMGQYEFRVAVLMSYRNKCCITGLSHPKMLIASHIKPWAVSKEKNERTNPSNGLCLNTFHDKAFDQGLMTIGTDYRIVISSQLKNAEMDETTKRWFMSYSGKEIMLPDKFYPEKEFIQYHNDMIFIP